MSKTSKFIEHLKCQKCVNGASVSVELCFIMYVVANQPVIAQNTLSLYRMIYLYRTLHIVRHSGMEYEPR